MKKNESQTKSISLTLIEKIGNFTRPLAIKLMIIGLIVNILSITVYTIIIPKVYDDKINKANILLNENQKVLNDFQLNRNILYLTKIVGDNYKLAPTSITKDSLINGMNTTITILSYQILQDLKYRKLAPRLDFKIENKNNSLLFVELTKIKKGCNREDSIRWLGSNHRQLVKEVKLLYNSNNINDPDIINGKTNYYTLISDHLTRVSNNILDWGGYIQYYQNKKNNRYILAVFCQIIGLALTQIGGILKK